MSLANVFGVDDLHGIRQDRDLGAFAEQIEIWRLPRVPESYC